MSEDLHQNGEASIDPTLQKGNESESDFDLESLFEDEQDPEAEKAKFLAQVNKVEKRNYKSLEDYEKTVKERHKEFAEQGRKEKEEIKPESQPTNSNTRYALELLAVRKPGSEHVAEDIKQLCKDTGLDPFEVWDKYKWLEKEAKSRAEEAEETDKSGKKISKPSAKVTGTGGGEELSDADRALLSRRPGLMEKHLKNNK